MTARQPQLNENRQKEGYYMNKKVILIMTDTQRTDMLGCYGAGDMRTPNLDRLAGEGIRFDQAYTCLLYTSRCV